MKPPFEKYSYFQPDEMLFIIRHDSDQSMEDQNIDSLIKWSNEYRTDDKLKNLEISRLPDRELHFPGTNNITPPKQDITLPKEIYTSPPFIPRGAFSIIPAKVRNVERDDEYVETSDLVKLIRDLDEIRGDHPLLSREITIEVVSPNWLATPTSDFSGGGGPGSEPIPFNGSNDNIPYELHFLSEKFNVLCPEKDKEKRGEGIKVAILDTAPCLHELVEAYDHYHTVDPNNPHNVKDHPLIERLLNPSNGSLTVHPASFEELLRMRTVYLKDHNYKMTDHGLFVAGIINTIAPAAELHLYEVLNPQGVGDIESIARGLWKAAEEHYYDYKKNEVDKPLVINCSLMLNIPLDGNPENPNSARPIPPNPNRRIPDHPDRPIVGHRLTDMNQEVLDKIMSDPNWVKRASAVIEWICNLIYGCGSRVIAAAGNDWKPDEDDGRPEARYPAAFQSVLGIGALPKGEPTTGTGLQEVSSYSNVSDMPGEVGVVALGGEKGEGKGVLGIYLGEFPNGKPNNNHWAWWAGTSFATPIVAGAITAVISGASTNTTTEGAILAMYEENVIENEQTAYLEDRLKVKQG